MNTFDSRNVYRAVVVVAILSIAFFIARLFPYIERPTAGFMAYFTAGKLLATHHDLSILYEGKQFHDSIPIVSNSSVEDEYRANPPTLSILFLPLTVFSASQGKLVWEVVSFIAVLISLLLLRKYFYLEKIEFIAFTGLTFAFTPVYINFVYGQLYGVLFLLHVILLGCWKSKKMFATSIAIALMLSLKGYGVLFLVLALFLREWRLIAYSLLNYVLLLIGSLFVVGTGTWSAYFSALEALLVSSPIAVTFQQNIQSFIGFFFLNYSLHGTPIVHWANMVQPVIGASCIIGISIVFWLSRNSSHASIAIPFSSAVIIGVMFAPRLFDYHYSFFLIPFLVCYKELSHAATKRELAGFGVSLFLLSTKIPYYYSIFQNTWLGIFGFPRIYGGVILLWLLYRIAHRNISHRTLPQ